MRPAQAGLELTASWIQSKSTTTRLQQPARSIIKLGMCTNQRILRILLLLLLTDEVYALSNLSCCVFACQIAFHGFSIEHCLYNIWSPKQA
jgi:hypothetical protein